MSIERMYRIYMTIKEMLKDRKYDKVEAGKDISTYDQFKKEFVICGKIEKQNMNLVCKNSKTGVLIMVCFLIDETIKSEHVKKIEKMMSGKVTKCILIYPNDITSQTRKHLENLSGISIEKFAENDLIINITKHKLMPKYEPLTSAEKKLFLKETKFNKIHLPKISLDDPVSRYYGISRGDILKIIRKSETAGEYVTYRICS